MLADTEDTWNEIFRQSGRSYREPKLVLFKGTATPATGVNLVATYFTGATPVSITTDDTTGRYLAVAPAKVLKDLHRTRRALLHRDNARLFMVASAETNQAIARDVEHLVAELDGAPAAA